MHNCVLLNITYNLNFQSVYKYQLFPLQSDIRKVTKLQMIIKRSECIIKGKYVISFYRATSLRN